MKLSHSPVQDGRRCRYWKVPWNVPVLDEQSIDALLHSPEQRAVTHSNQLLVPGYHSPSECSVWEMQVCSRIVDLMDATAISPPPPPLRSSFSDGLLMTVFLTQTRDEVFSRLARSAEGQFLSACPSHVFISHVGS